MSFNVHNKPRFLFDKRPLIIACLCRINDKFAVRPRNERLSAASELLLPASDVAHMSCTSYSQLHSLLVNHNLQNFLPAFS